MPSKSTETTQESSQEDKPTSIKHKRRMQRERSSSNPGFFPDIDKIEKQEKPKEAKCCFWFRSK